MKQQSKEPDHDKIGTGSEAHNHVHNHIRAADKNGDDERNERIKTEEETKRIRSERQSIREKQNKRTRPLL
jgi:hypothetical protein